MSAPRFGEKRGAAVFERPRRISYVSHMALVYRVGFLGVADIAVCDVGSQGLADLLVWRTDDQGAARNDDGVWCFVASSGLATTRIWEVSSRGSADLLICYVSSRGLSGWRRGHTLIGRL